MKKLLALLAVCALLLPCAVCAEGNYLRQLPQEAYTLTNLIAPEACPEVVLTTDSTYRRFGSNGGTTQYLTFPCPGGALANSLTYDSAHFLDVENFIQYSYQLVSSDSYEEFVNKAEKDEYILLDGSGKTAAYVDPDRGRAYGMIGVTDFGKSAKLRITISLDNLGRRATPEAKLQALSDAILPELERVKNAMKTESRDVLWDTGAFDGAKLLNVYDPSYMLKLDFPTLSIDNTQVRMSLVRVQDYTLQGVYFLRPGAYVEVEIRMDDYSYAATKLKEGDAACSKVTLANGSEWIVYWANARDDGSSDYVHCAKVLPTPANMPSYKQDSPLYLTVHFNGERISWATLEDLMEDLQKFDEAAVVMNAADDPYVPAPVETQAPEAPENPQQPQEQAADGTWTCPACGNEGNTGKFCPECGGPKPEESADWTCPNCGAQGNTGKFCPSCGTPKP